MTPLTPRTLLTRFILGHNRAVEWKALIQELVEEQNKMINVQLGGGGPDGRQAQIDGTYLGGGQKYGRGRHTCTHTRVHTGNR